jgi:uncharacterized membrane protein YdjX (TVP38/TMEM64 family)
MRTCSQTRERLQNPFTPAALGSNAVDPEMRRSLIILAACGALVGVAAVARGVLGIEWNAESIRDTVRGYGAWGPVLFVALMGFRYFLLVPSQIMLIAGGLVFGAAAGTLYGALGLGVSGVTAFALARWVGRESVLANVPPNLHWAFSAASSRAGAAVVAVGTAWPVGPIGAFHAGAGLTAMTIPAFLLALAAGASVRAWIYAYFGSALVEGDRTLLIAGIALFGLAAAPLVHPRSRAWIKARLSEGN